DSRGADLHRVVQGRGVDDADTDAEGDEAGEEEGQAQIWGEGGDQRRGDEPGEGAEEKERAQDRRGPAPVPAVPALHAEEGEDAGGVPRGGGGCLPLDGEA